MGGFSLRPAAIGVAPAPGATRFPQLDLSGVKEFISDYSVAIKYWKAVSCPCTNALSGQPSISCHQCRGLGWFHLEAETDPMYARAMVHSRSGRSERKDGGRAITGSVSVTLFPGVIPADGDIVQMCADVEVVNNEYHTAGATLTDGSTAETLRFRDVSCVETVLYQDATTQAILKLGSDDWSFNAAARRIETKLQKGTKYSVRYLARPEYVIVGETAKPLHRTGHDDNLPDPQRTGLDLVFPYNVIATRLDRAIVQRQRGAVDHTTQSTFNSPQGRGPFR